jgi:hypothetical protein
VEDHVKSIEFKEKDLKISIFPNPDDHIWINKLDQRISVAFTIKVDEGQNESTTIRFGINSQWKVYTVDTEGTNFNDITNVEHGNHFLSIRVSKETNLILRKTWNTATWNWFLEKKNRSLLYGTLEKEEDRWNTGVKLSVKSPEKIGINGALHWRSRFVNSRNSMFVINGNIFSPEKKEDPRTLDDSDLTVRLKFAFMTRCIELTKKNPSRLKNRLFVCGSKTMPWYVSNNL